MSERLLIEPDEQFVKEIAGQGGEDVKLCSQCATCSVSCKITPYSHPFPRKEMIWMQWGMKDRLMADPDIWACHQCNDCSVNCPRQAKPGDIFASIREYSFRHFATPSFFGKLASTPSMLPVFFLIPIVILLGIFATFGNLGNFAGSGDALTFNAVFPTVVVDATFIGVSFWLIFTILASLGKFWKQLRVESRSNGHKGNLIGSAIATVMEIITHKQFNGCDENSKRSLGHLMTFWGFLGLTATTGCVWIMTWFLGFETPLELTNPVKILGNVSTVVVLIGLSILWAMRASGDQKVGRSTYSDWLFISVLLTTIVTGFLSQVTRLADIAVAANSIYFIHLVMAFSLLFYLPYTKFAHMLYRLTAITYNKYVGRV